MLVLGDGDGKGDGDANGEVAGDRDLNWANAPVRPCMVATMNRPPPTPIITSPSDRTLASGKVAAGRRCRPGSQRGVFGPAITKNEKLVVGTTGDPLRIAKASGEAGSAAVGDDHHEVGEGAQCDQPEARLAQVEHERHQHERRRDDVKRWTEIAHHRGERGAEQQILDARPMSATGHIRTFTEASAAMRPCVNTPTRSPSATA